MAPRAKKTTEPAVPLTETVVETAPAVVEAAPELKYTLAKHESDIRAGMEVIEVVSKFKGHVTSRIDYLTGNTQFAIQPAGKGDDMPEAHFADWHTIGIIGPGHSAILPPIDSTVKITLGQPVKDKASGLVGVTTDRITFQNGCVYFSVLPPIDKKKPAIQPSTVLLEHKRLEPQSKGVRLDTPEPAPKVDEPKKKATGGPMRSMKSVLGSM